MWIQGSTLSITQRSLAPAGQMTPTQAKAQELATQLIQNYSAPHVAEVAIKFLVDQVHPSISRTGDFLSIQIPSSHRASPALPATYGVKGGAARESLISALGLRAPQQPRDIDLVRRGFHRVPADDDLARAIMPRDFELGARVELIRDMNGYLSSRDLTINEVVALDDVAHTSLLCLLDTVGLVIRPSKYRSGSLHKRPTLFGQSLLKMIRLYAEGVSRSENWSIVGIPEEVSFSEFDLAVHLNKSYQRGRQVAETFLQTCELLSLIGASQRRIETALEELEHLRHGERGLFPDVPKNEWGFLTAEAKSRDPSEFD